MLLQFRFETFQFLAERLCRIDRCLRRSERPKREIGLVTKGTNEPQREFSGDLERRKCVSVIPVSSMRSSIADLSKMVEQYE
jgi:hypothetical protein